MFRKPAARAPATTTDKVGVVVEKEEEEEEKRVEELELSPVEDFDIDEEDVIPPTEDIERSPSPESKEEEEARVNVARALVKLEELKSESEELVLSSTELLLKTIQSTNDYFLLFNPKLMTQLRQYKEEARKILDELGRATVAPNAA